MIIFKVQNEVASVLFVSKKDAEVYLSKYNSVANDLELYEVYVIDDTAQDNKALDRDAKKRRRSTQPLATGQNMNFKKYILKRFKQLLCHHLRLRPMYHSYKCLNCGKVISD